MAAKKTRQIKTRPGRSLGLFPIAGGRVEFTPDAVFDKFDTAKEDRYSFTLRQYTVEERAQIEADNENIQSRGVLWARDNGVDMSAMSSSADFTNPQTALSMVAMTTAFSSFADKTLRSEIIRGAILGMQNFTDSEGGPVPFKPAQGGGMDPEQFALLPDIIIRALGGELSRISYLDDARRLGL